MGFSVASNSLSGTVWSSAVDVSGFEISVTVTLLVTFAASSGGFSGTP